MDWTVFLVNNCPIVNKTKFLIVFQFPDGLKGFLINSKHHKLLKKKFNKVCVVKIPHRTNDYLDYDSFVDCTKLIPLEESHISDQRGYVCELTKSNIMKSVLACPVLELKLKKHLLEVHQDLIK